MIENEDQQQKKKELNEKSNKKKPKEKKYYGKLLIFLIIIAIIIEYYVFVYEIIIKNLKKKNIKVLITLLIIFHILIILLIISFIKTMTTRPGDIPLYWGFYIGDDDIKRKRYCLICNVFKPERSHHCSVCNSCVLNMDHHCPWVDNCIGFYNRKFFMQLLFYVFCITFFIDFSVAYFVYEIINDIINKRLKYSDIFHAGIILVSYSFIFVFSFIFLAFFKFHIQLVLNNSTTIESLDKEHQIENEKFNIGIKENWVQVFGNNCCLWLLPLDLDSGKPIGDGLTWKIRENLNSLNSYGSNFNEGPNARNSNNPIEMNNFNNNNFATSPISPTNFNSNEQDKV